MENTLENAQDFYLNNLGGIDGEPSVFEFATIMSKYATSVRPVVVLPKRRTGLGIDVDFTIAAGFNSCLSELRRLNPDMEFTETK